MVLPQDTDNVDKIDFDFDIEDNKLDAVEIDFYFRFSVPLNPRCFYSTVCNGNTAVSGNRMYRVTPEIISSLTSYR